MPCPRFSALPLPSWLELGVSAAGVKGGGGRRCWPAPAPGRRRCALARLPPGEGTGRAAPLLSCSQQWPWGQLCSLRPLPTWTQGSLTPSSWHPASCQPQLLPCHSLPTACLVSLDTHPNQGLPCWKGECGVCTCCGAALLMLSALPIRAFLRRGGSQPACSHVCG